MYFDLRVIDKKGFTNIVPKSNPFGYLRVGTCKHTNCEVLTLVLDDEGLCLHNVDRLDEKDELVAVEKFKNQDISFFDHVEMFLPQDNQ